MDYYTKACALGFGLVMLAVAFSLVIHQLKSGGSCMNHLEKAIQIPVDQSRLAFFMEVFRQRLAGLGFEAVDNTRTRFAQAAGEFPALGSAAHSKTGKILTVQSQDSSDDQVVVTLILRYLHLIVIDTGESAYRDAVLNYVSGKADQMIIAPNESLMAMNSLIGGAFACVLSGVLIVFNTPQLWPAIPILAVTEMAVGMLAIFAIKQKPGEIIGQWMALAGIALSLIAIAASIAFIVTTKITAAS